MTKSRIVAVTGGGSGIGRTAAKRLGLSDDYHLDVRAEIAR